MKRTSKKWLNTHDALIARAKHWEIEVALAEKVILRDKACVYCGAGGRATWEHIINPTRNHGLVKWNKSWNIALCCNSCNSSKGDKKLLDWFDSGYCKKKNINQKTVANIVKTFIRLRNNV